MGLAERFFSIADELLLIARLDGVVEDASSAWSPLLGRPAAELSGAPLFDLVHEGDRQRVEAKFAHARAGQRIRFQCRMRAVDGGFLDVHFGGKPSLVDGVVLFVARLADERPATPADLVSDKPLSDLVRDLAAELGVRHAFVASAVGWPLTRARIVAGWLRGTPLAEVVEYPLPGTPCEGVVQGEACVVPQKLQGHFPEYAFLADIGAESYVGIPIFDDTGDILGHVCALGEGPMDQGAVARSTEAVKRVAALSARALERLRLRHIIMQASEDLDIPPGLPLVRELSRRLAEATRVRYVLVSTYEGDPAERGNALVFFDGQTLHEPFTYELRNTPCHIVSRGQVVRYDSNVVEAFPRDIDLMKLNAQSYVGVPLVDSTGKVFAQLTLMDVRPMHAVEQKELILRLFASRIGAELERAWVREEAARHKASFRLLVEHAADGLIVFDAAGILIDVNPAALEDLGARYEELLGLHLRDALGDAPGEALLCEALELEPGKRSCIETSFLRRDGSTFPVEVRTMRFRDAGRDLFLSVARDVTEQRLAAEAMEKALHALSTPILEVWKGVALLPLVGAVDRDRATRVMATLLEHIVRTSAEVTILDLTGVAEVDASTASHLLDIAKAASLLGSRCLVSGIAPGVARTLVELGAHAEEMRTFGTLQSALNEAIGHGGQGFAPRGAMPLDSTRKSRVERR